jgi:serine/threonine kinase PknH
VRIAAKAHLEAGQGGWGIWCRGTADNSRQYEFSVTHAGDAYIKNGYDRALGKTNIPGFDITRENTMTVDCRDANGDVQLTMSMNGEQVLSAQGSDGDGGLLGPGPVGLHAFAFGDTAGAPADVRFSYFEAVRLP